MSTGRATVNKVTIERKRSDIRPWLNKSNNCKQKRMCRGNPIQQSSAQRAAGHSTAISQHAVSQTTSVDQGRAIFSRADCSPAGTENEVTDSEVTARPVATSTSSSLSTASDNDAYENTTSVQSSKRPSVVDDFSLMNVSSENADVEECDVVIQMLNTCTPPAQVAEFDDVQLTELDQSNFDFDRFIAESKCNLTCVDLLMSDNQGQTVSINALFDTGTQLSIVKEDAVSQLVGESLADVQLQGFDGKLSSGRLVSFHAKFEGADFIPIKFVVCKNVTHDCLLSLSDYRRLLSAQQASSSVPDNCPTLPQQSLSSPVDAVLFDKRDPEIITRTVPELITENVHTVHTESDQSSVDPSTSGLIPDVNDSDQLSLEGLNHTKANELMKE